MTRTHRTRIVTAIIVILTFVAIPLSQQELEFFDTPSSTSKATSEHGRRLDQLDVKGRAPKTGYQREQFGNDWQSVQGCDMRNIILARDLDEIVVDRECHVVAGVLDDPYTGKTIQFERGAHTSDDVQIDHVVALSNAWQTGAQYKARALRIKFANDPLNLLAVEGEANQQKSDSDAATWLPPSKAFRCEYIIRQIDIKHKYALWVTQAEKTAMQRILATC